MLQRSPSPILGSLLALKRSMRNEDFFLDHIEEGETETLKGNNFLVSAFLILKKQKRELVEENKRLRARLEMVEHQNAAFLDLSAERLLRS